LAILAAFSAATLGVEVADAQESTRVFIRYAGSEDETSALEAAASRFRSPVLRFLDVRIVGTEEMEEVYAQCRSRIGVSPIEERTCQLEAARRLSMDQVIEVSISSLERGRYELTLQLWDPHNNEILADEFVEIERDSLEDAARQGMGALAAKYLCSQGVSAQCEASNRGLSIAEVGREDGSTESVPRQPIDPTEIAAESNEFVLIEPGWFEMGSPPGEVGRDDDEEQHAARVTRSFYLQAREVTQVEWTALMGHNPSYFV